jgi:hypothetical protein
LKPHHPSIDDENKVLISSCCQERNSPELLHTLHIARFGGIHLDAVAFIYERRNVDY